MSDTADTQDATGRRAAIVEQIRAETGIDEAMIARLVDGFYDRVRADRLLGPVFAGLLRTAAGGAESMTLDHYQAAFLPLLYGVALALVLTLVLKETGPAARRPAPAAAAKTD
jgi:hypothetical protein